MKIHNILFSSILMFLGFGCHVSNSNSNQSISIKNNDTGYSFEASYPARKNEMVVEYIEKILNEDKLFTTPQSEKDSAIKLGDSVKFHLKASPGYLHVRFSKEENSYTAYKKLEDMCQGVKKILE